MRVVFLFFTLILFPASAFSQVNIDECNGNPTGCSVVSSTTSSTTTALVGGIILTVVLGRNKSTALKAYLRENTVAIRRDVSFGAGPTLEDISALLDVRDPAFGGWSRKVRHVFLDAVVREDADAIIAMTTLAFRGI